MGNKGERYSPFSIRTIQCHYPFFYRALELYMEAEKKVIVSEYPFSEKQKGRLRDLADTYAYEVITIRLTADFEVLWERRYQRDREPERNSDESSMNESTLNLLWERSMNLM